MKKAFVLDENIIPLAWEGKDERGQTDLSGASLLLQIIQNCHALILSDFLNREYSKKTDEVKRLHRGAPMLNAINVIHQAFAKESKIIFESDISVNFPKGSFHDDDIPIVSLAARRHAILVSTDDNLITKLVEKKITQLHNFQAKRPGDALRDASSSV